MKILLDFGFGYFINGKTGVGKYEENIIFGLKRPYDIITPEQTTAKLPENATPIILKESKRKFTKFKRFLFSADFVYKGYDIIITGSACYRKSKHVKQIPIIHDLMSFTEPKNYTLRKRFENKLAMRSLKNAYKIIAVSQSTKQALHDLFKIDFNKIYVIPNITDFYIENKNKKDLIFIGDLRKTKNLDFLIKGFAEYKKHNDVEEKLIIAGNKKFEYETLVSLVNSLDLDKDIIFKGYITDEEKIDLFENAKGLVFLSNNEGFGIPLLEANVNLIPVLCSEIPVFHEVLTEKGAVFVDNKDINKIAEGLKKLRTFRVDYNYSLELREKYSVKTFNMLLEDLMNDINV